MLLRHWVTFRAIRRQQNEVFTAAACPRPVFVGKLISMNEAKNSKKTKKENKVKRGEELLAVLKEILSDDAKILEAVGTLNEKFVHLEEMVRKALPPNPGRFTRL